MCDVVLEVGGVTFPCHRALLTSSSQYFWALFGETTAERSAPSVSLPALTPEGLDAVLNFLYSGWLGVSPATLPAVLEAARYLQVEAAVAICERFVTDGLNADDCCRYADLAERHALSDALAAADRTVAAEMGTLLRERRGDLLRLNVRSLAAALASGDEMPGVKEAELVKLVLDWLDENGPLPLLKSNLLLSHLRFGLVAPSDLAELSAAHGAMATPLVRSQVTRALEYHGSGSAQPIRQSRQSALRAPPRVLLVGGGPRPDWPEREMLAFDPRSRKFSPVGSGVPRRLRHHCVCSVGGFLFVIGGEEANEGDEEGEKFAVAAAASKRTWRYDPRFDRWEAMAPMLERRERFACCVVEDAIYAIGGRGERPGAAAASVEFYEVAAGAWRRGTPMPRPLHGHACAALGGGIYVSGGRSGDRDDRAESGRDVVFWDLGGGVWEKRASTAIGRFGHRLAAAGGFVYALLGMNEPFCDIERYDPRSDHWTRLRPHLAGSFDYGMASTPSGNLLVFGGRRWRDGREVTVRSVMEYDTKADLWREICQLPRPLAGAECTTLPLPD